MKCINIVVLPFFFFFLTAYQHPRPTTHVAPHKPLTGIETVAPENFVVPYSEEPVVSIVIPVFNNFAYTKKCLFQLASIESSVPFETIVVDDYSTDETIVKLKLIKGIKRIRNKANQGYLRSTNIGIFAARGRYVLLLNNDTIVQSGALEAMLEIFKSHKRAGLVGAKLLNPDGTLQEAGGIIFKDASGCNYGLGGHRFDGLYNYARKTDYCSAAAVMVPASLLHKLHGFDEFFAPAYYEDADLAFRVRQAGFEVFYQPKAEVVHIGSVTYGGPSDEKKRLLCTNRKKFSTRWHAALTNLPDNSCKLSQASCYHYKKKILVVDYSTPTPDRDSGSMRTVNIMKILVDEGYKVYFIPDNKAYIPGYTEDLQQLGVEVLYHPFYKNFELWMAEHGKFLDVVILARYEYAQKYIDKVKALAPQATLIFDTVDLHFLRLEREAKIKRTATSVAVAFDVREQELAAIEKSMITFVVSDYEKKLLKSIFRDKKIAIVSNIHKVSPPDNKFHQRCDILFVGSFLHTPNVDALTWFVREVWPSIVSKLPNVKLHIVGDNPPSKILELLPDNVIMHGYVPDMSVLYENTRLSIAPLRYGAGVKGKVNQSMAHGVPVVMTSVAAEGMFILHKNNALIADQPEQFAQAVIDLYTNEKLWNLLSRNSIDNIKNHFSFEIARKVLRKILQH